MKRIIWPIPNRHVTSSSVSHQKLIVVKKKKKMLSTSDVFVCLHLLHFIPILLRLSVVERESESNFCASLNFKVIIGYITWIQRRCSVLVEYWRHRIRGLRSHIIVHRLMIFGNITAEGWNSILNGGVWLLIPMLLQLILNLKKVPQGKIAFEVFFYWLLILYAFWGSSNCVLLCGCLDAGFV